MLVRGIGFQPVENTGENDRLEAYPTIYSQPFRELRAMFADRL